MTRERSAFASGRLVWLVLTVGSLLQQPGKVTFDTKHDLTADPGGLLSRSLHLWNPEASFGELQNQAYGYLFPQGPFFLLGDLAGVPDWVVQRLWSALLLIVAYEGTRYVARALGLPAYAGILAGLVYALSPRLLGSVGVLTGEVLPGAFLPWAVLPLVLAWRGRLGPRQAALWSGVAVLCMSGINAAGTLAVLPLAAAVVLAQWRQPHGRRLAAWWLVAIGTACAWWLVPLLTLGRYSPPFLDFIETAGATTFPTSWSNDVRGADHWLAYYAIGDQPWWPGAHPQVTEPVLLVVWGLVAAAGLAGLAHRGLPLGRAFGGAALLGLVCLTAGNPATLGSLVDGPVRGLLDGPLAPFRNVHKIDPIVRLPLALGAGHALVVVLRRLRERRPERSGIRRGVAVAAMCAVAVGGAPLLTGDLRMPGFEKVPDAWSQTAEYLAEQDDGRALVLPGSGFGLQTWGWTIDEPLQGVAESPWVTRSQVPLVPGPTARYLDTIERRIASAEGSSGLADLLARGGISHVVLRRDLDTSVTETVPFERAETALVASPGLERVAGFGRSGFGEQALIDVYRVDRDVAPVALLAEESVRPLYGAPDDILTALEAGVLDPEEPVRITSEAGAGRVVGDGYRRVERQFGRVHDALSQVLSVGDPWENDRPSHDFPGVPGVARATAELPHGTRVTASTSQGGAEEYAAVRPEFGPHAALDGNLGTAWRSGTLRAPDEQWLQADLGVPVRGGTLAARFDLSGSAARVTRVRVRTWTPDGELATVYGLPASGLLLATLPEGPVRRVRLEVVEATGPEAAYGQVVVQELSLPGQPTGRTTVLPETLSADDALVLRLDPPRRACVDVGLGPLCDDRQARPGEDAGRLDRTVEVAEAGTWDVSGSVVAQPGQGSAALFDRVDDKVTARAGSVLAGDPAVSGVYAADGNPGTPWLTEPQAGRASLVLTWPGSSRVVRGISVTPAPGGALTPDAALIRSRGIERLVDLDWTDRFEPFVARGRIRIIFIRPEGVGTTNRPMGVGEVEIDGLEGLSEAPLLETRTGALCGLGPQVRIDDEVHDTEVVGTLDDVRLGRPLEWRVCDGPVELDEGSHRIVARSTVQFQPVTLGWRPRADEDAQPSSDRAVEIRRWDATDRSVEVGPGDAAVLRVAENVNDGWEATLDGTPLEEVTIDGWQQGFRVPAGAGGTVELVYAPDAAYRAGLLVGLLLALALVAGALLGSVGDRRRRVVVTSAPAPSAPLSPRAAYVARGVTGAGLLVLGGPVAAAAFAVAAIRRLRAATLVGGSVLIALSGFLAAFADGTRLGRPGIAADSFAAAGVGLLAGAVLFERATRRAQREAPAEAPRERQAPSLRWLRRHHVMVVGALLVAGQAVLRTVAATGSYYWQDDFLHLDLARTLGWSEDFLVRDYSGHLEMGSYAVFWAVAQGSAGSFLPAVLILVGLQLVASCLLLVLLRMLFGERPWILVPFAAYLVTPLGLATATWFAAGLQALPLQVAMLTSLIGLVRHDATDRVRWLVVSVAGLAVGLLFWQKAALVLPALLGLEILVLAAGLPLRERVRRLWRRRTFWLAHVVVLGGYVGVYLAVTSSSRIGDPMADGVGRSLREMFLGMLVPGLFGGPWHSDGAASTIYADTQWPLQVAFAALALLLVVASVLRNGRVALAAWLLVVVYLAADLALVLLGRGAYLGLVARDPRYFTDALPVIVIGVCAAFAGRPRQVPDRGDRGRVHRAVLPLAAVVVVVASGLTTSLQLLPDVQQDRSRDYVETVTDELAADPGAAVLASPVPADVSISVSLESLLRAMGREQRLDRPGAEPLLVDASGRLIPTRLEEVDLSRDGPVVDCGWAVDDQAETLGDLVYVDDRQRVLRLDYVSGTGGVLHVRVGGLEQAVAYDAGIGAVHVVVTGQSGKLEVWNSSTRAGLCVSRLQRGVPVPTD